MINKLYTKYACTWQTQGEIFTLKYDDEEHMQELEKITKENIGVLDYKTNVLAKMTDYSFFVEHPSFKKLGQWFYGKVYEHQLVDKQYLQEDRFHAQIRDAWGSVFNKGDSVKRHDHLGSKYASALYFDNYANLQTEVGEFQTERGLIITIPSHLKHWVDPLSNEVNRINLVWNWFARTSQQIKDQI